MNAQHPQHNFRLQLPDWAAWRRRGLAGVLGAGFWLLGALQPAVATINNLPIYEPFNYPTATQLGTGNSSTNWDSGNSASSSSAIIRDTAALSFPGLPASSTNGLASGSGTGKNRGMAFASQTNTTMYASFLLNVKSFPTTGLRVMAALTQGTNTGPTFAAGVLLDTQGCLQICKNDTTADTASTNAAIRTNVTYLVVIGYTHNGVSSSDDQVSLWLNPAVMGSDAAMPVPLLSITNNSDVTYINGFYYLSPSSGANASCTFYMDEVRVGGSWSSVVPAACPSVQRFTVTGGGASCTAQGYTVGLSGSQVGVDYYLWTNGLWSGQVMSGTGSALSFGSETVSASYTVSASNTSSGCTFWMTNAVAVGVWSAPVFITPPTNVVVADGSVAVFSPVVSGDGLVYQWQRNGTNLIDGGNISGANGSVLLINPVSSADVASYSLTVVGSCEPVLTSGVVTLSLGAGRDMVFFGDIFATPQSPWDIGRSSDWWDPDQNLTTFCNGDNVIFDDINYRFGFGQGTVSLISPYLAPASILANPDGGEVLVFQGSGSLIGSGVLCKSGTGTLIISNANAFSGGIFISNGTVATVAANAFGTGPIVLMDGNLAQCANVASTITNAIDIEGNGCITVTNTSTSALSLTGPLTGSMGSLTFSNDTAGRGPTIRLMGSGYDFELPINLALGNDRGTNNGTNLVLSLANTTGTQVYGGTISGGGMLQRNGSGGFAVVCGANQLTNSTLLANGVLGVGGSAALGISPVWIDNSGGYPGLLAWGQARVVTNYLMFTNTGDGRTFVLTGTNALTLAGDINLNGANRSFNVSNSALTTISGVLSNGALSKLGPGVLVLTGPESYTGVTSITNGTLLVNGSLASTGVNVWTTNGILGGSGTIAGAVTVQSGGRLAPSASGNLCTLTISGALTFAGGSGAVMQVNKSTGGHDLVKGFSSANYNGTLVINNQSGNLALGDAFQLFTGSGMSGSFTNVQGTVGNGLSWAFDGTTGKATVVAGVTINTNQCRLQCVSTNSSGVPTLLVNWPSDHLGWALQAQTNSLSKGLGTNWVTVAGSTALTNWSTAIGNSTNAVFFRLILPQ